MENPTSQYASVGVTHRAGKDAGNSVRIRRNDGWETQYSHLKRRSVTVRPGQLGSRWHGNRAGRTFR